jgi:inner membrane protein
MAISDISGLLSERYERQQRAEEEVRRMAGGQQLIEGPVIVFGEEELFDLAKPMPIVPLKQASIDATVNTEELHRGSYSYESFLGTVAIRGEVEIPQQLALPSLKTADGGEVPPTGYILLRISERHALQSVDTATLNGKPLTIARSSQSDTIAFSTPLLAELPRGVPHTFEVTLRVRGTKGISFSPLSHAFTVSLKSNSTDPSFVGTILPAERKIDTSGSMAQWRGDSFSTPLSCYPGCPSVDHYFVENSFTVGAVFLNSLSPHTMVERAIKYRDLFVLLTFGAFILFEFITLIRIHPIQYFLVGGALTVYYLLLLSLAEQVGFLLAYTAAAGVTIFLISGYAAAILRSRKHGAVVGGLLISTYAFLYTVLQEQDLALLFGSVGLTIFLAVFMFITRRIDWYALIPALPTGVAGASAEVASVREIDAGDSDLTGRE